MVSDAPFVRGMRADDLDAVLAIQLAG